MCVCVVGREAMETHFGRTKMESRLLTEFDFVQSVSSWDRNLPYQHALRALSTSTDSCCLR